MVLCYWKFRGGRLLLRTHMACSCTDSCVKNGWSAALATQLPLDQTSTALVAEEKSLTSGAKAQIKRSALHSRLKACSTRLLSATTESALVLIVLLGIPALQA